jgi:hypothetical protein
MLRRILIAAVVIAALLFLPPLVNLQRFKAQIAQTLTASIGRTVTFTEVHFQVLPQPGFVFSNLSVAEDPGFGFEPMLTAPEMTASLRLASLWRGRMEISRLSFDSPSLNVTRNDSGYWNLGTSVQRAASVPAAPTAQTRASQAPRFPYIEVTDGRVNIKTGLKKAAFTLVEADFSLWLESPNHYKMRLASRPIRTDANLGDTGRLRADATLTREHDERIEEIPLKVSLRWDDAQLGQATWLLTGEDRGWRGDLQLRAELNGTARSLDVSSTVSVENFRRYDIANLDSFRLRADCSAQLVRASRGLDLRFALQDLSCLSQVGDGKVELTGDGSLAERSYDLKLVATDVPISRSLELYRRAKLNVSDSLRGSGTLSAELHASTRVACVEGTASLKDARIQDENYSLDVTLTPAPSGQAKKTIGNQAACFRFGPLNFGGKDTQLVVSAENSLAGARLSVKGSSEAESLLAAAKSFGLVARDYHATGKVDIDAQLEFPSGGFRYPEWRGSAQSTELKLPQGITLRKAAFAFLGDRVMLKNFTSTLPDFQTEVSGSISWPVRCDPSPCAASFALHATSLDIDRLNQELNPAFRSRNWFYLPRIFSSNRTRQEPVSAFLVFNASGSFTVDRLTMRKLQIRTVSVDADWQDGVLRLNNFSGNSLGGAALANSTLQFKKGMTVAGEVALTNFDLTATGDLLGIQWGRGKASLNAAFSFEGATQEKIKQTLKANLTFAAKDGALNSLASPGDLHYNSWAGRASVEGTTLTIEESTLTSRGQRIAMTGKVGEGLSLELRLVGGNRDAAITGTLAAPNLTPAASAEVAASNRSNAAAPKSPVSKRP